LDSEKPTVGTYVDIDIICIVGSVIPLIVAVMNHQHVTVYSLVLLIVAILIMYETRITSNLFKLCDGQYEMNCSDVTVLVKKLQAVNVVVALFCLTGLISHLILSWSSLTPTTKALKITGIVLFLYVKLKKFMYLRCFLARLDVCSETTLHDDDGEPILADNAHDSDVDEPTFARSRLLVSVIALGVLTGLALLWAYDDASAWAYEDASAANTTVRPRRLVGMCYCPRGCALCQGSYWGVVFALIVVFALKAGCVGALATVNPPAGAAGFCIMFWASFIVTWMIFGSAWTAAKVACHNLGGGCNGNDAFTTGFVAALGTFATIGGVVKAALV
jgi:hypothetical protein